MPLRRTFAAAWLACGPFVVPFGAAHAPSPDARFEHPVLRSLDADGASPSWLRLSANAGSRGMGSPSPVLWFAWGTPLNLQAP